MQSLEMAILQHIRRNEDEEATVESLSDALGGNRAAIRTACKNLCEQDNPPLVAENAPPTGARGRPRKIFTLNKPRAPLTIRILGYLGDLKVNCVATTEQVASAMAVDQARASRELNDMLEHGYVSASQCAMAWKVAPGIIPPDTSPLGIRSSLRLKILQYLGTLRTQESTALSNLAGNVHTTAGDVSLELKTMLRDQLVVEVKDKAGPKKSPEWRLAPGIIPPAEDEIVDMPETRLRGLRDIKTFTDKTKTA